MSTDAENLEISVSFEQLAALEDDFEQVELEVTRYQDKLSRDLYAKRDKLIADIPNFWQHVFEVAPEEFELVFKPTDLTVLESLKNLYVTRFDLPDGDARSFSIKWEFEDNEYFEDKVLEKKFIYRQSPTADFAGLVSDPVKINWKAGKDLTDGLLDLVLKVDAEEKAGKSIDDETDAKKELKKKIEDTPLGDLSFFAWFGFRGPRITEEENKEALKKEEQKRQDRKAGKVVEDDKMDEDEDDEDDLFDKAYEYEIYPNADDLALCIVEDIWPDAIKLFLRSQDDDLSLDFEDLEDDDEDDDEEMEGTDKADPPAKKRKA